MCGIAALQIRNPALRGELGGLMHGMLCEIVERGPDSAGLALYGSDRLTPEGSSAITVITDADPAALAETLRASLPEGAEPTVVAYAESVLVNAEVEASVLEEAVRAALPGESIIGRGSNVAVLKGVGHPVELAEVYGLTGISGTQALSHTRMATESAVTAVGAHPFTVAEDLCLVHNGSFSNHASIRRWLRAEGVEFDSENDSEVAARYIAWRMGHGDDLKTALEALQGVFDGFYTLVVTTADSMAVVRDPIACKPAIIAETDDWIAMASEYRALAGLPGVEDARVFEPSPGVVYTWALAPVLEGAS
ncbi:glutamine amidotransferase [Microbacterium trichothecenolyticum]|uniref:Glutamine amidotransferase n=1 Tax=Microbacterium ureisolvens TaxID=2781186 RepID=A0ABS7I1M5_9MICO|nr:MULTISPECIES: glutamine amidotransferase [Microbacterium]MBW9110716.1 glutamine amidotransferase [Microbacterium ureisolvens]MBW9119558.1 glutamine amidotransferase [Microbacterium trichothecenolyticum]